jgi:malate dehydrogenase
MGNMLDLSRFVQFIHEATGHSRESIRALVVGEHGENMLPLPRFSTISGIPLTDILPKEKLDQIVADTRQVAAKVIELKGATVHAPGNAISAIVEAILKDRKKVIPVATPLDGQYGQSNVSIGVPAVIGRNGVEKIIELDFDQQEREWFNKGIESVRTALAGI